MKTFVRILLLTLLVIPAQLSSGQSSGSISDSSHVVRKNDKSVNDSRQRKMNQDKITGQDQIQNGNPYQNRGSGTGQGNRSSLKRINSARPDMTRMRNARPPDILRPSGSLLPRGIGKPGGALRPGGR
jgi:hypothetical protein